MTSYIIIMLALAIQTDRAAPAQWVVLLQQGQSEYISGHFAAAESLFLDALGQIPRSNATLRAQVLGDLGSVYTEQEEFSKAERAYSESLSLSEQLSDSRNSALMLQNLGVLYSLEGRNDEALRLVSRARQLAQSAVPSDPDTKAQVLVGFGIVQYHRNNTRGAERAFNEALEIVRASNVPFDTSVLLNNLGAVYLQQHKLKLAENVLKRALQMKEADKSMVDRDLTPELNMLGSVYMATGEFAEAERQYDRSLKILESRRSDSAPAIARVLHSLSKAYSKLNRQSESEAALREAAEIAHDNLSKDFEMAQILEDYFRLLERHGQKQEAANLLAQIKLARATADLVVRPHPQ